MNSDSDVIKSAGSTVLGLIKFGQRGYLEKFVAGSLYMNPLRYFVDLEGDAQRGDLAEATNFQWSPGCTLQVKIDGEYENVGVARTPIRHRFPTDQNINVFCLYAVRGVAGEAIADERVLGLGDSAAVILDVDEFLSRTRLAAERAELRLCGDLVRYIDEATYSGPMGVFKKSSRFSYQKEYRLALAPGTGDPHQLEVGPLDDIVILIPSNEVNSRLRIAQASHPEC